MASSSVKSAYWKGFRDATPFIVVIIPFSTLFGVIATEAGLSVFEILSMSVVVIAGAAQFTALQLMTENAPTFVVLASSLAVNLRMAMYSASLTPYLGAAPGWQRAIMAYFTVDQSYALSVLKFETEPKMTLPERVAYFMGTVSPVCPNWYLFTLVGALVGQSIPPWMALDFAVPITFLAMIGPMLRTGAHLVAALVSVALALCFAWVPYNLGLMVAGLGGMMAGAQTEVIVARRADT
ncbi:AzlC family ABC transporter permease [uncultured Shimia sp.]|uniref:AzlC family ABC transporter permease n=1 Tax=uncultured Shimia sp. TaxID=573152 RepID=UPI0026182396|nr:AzlC family ABC transporter permease [uncultured Shimia sp.]